MSKSAASVVLGLLSLSLVGVCSAAQLGPPQPPGEEGQLTVSGGYLYNKGTWEPTDVSALFTAETIEQHNVYGQVGYSFVQGWEAYGRIGAGNPQGENSLPIEGGYDFDGGWKMSAVFGARGMAYEAPQFGIGPFLQMELYSSYEDEFDGAFAEDVPDLGGAPVRGKLNYENAWIANFGAAIQHKVQDKAVIYGGPIFHFSKADVGYEVEITTPQGPLMDEDSTEAEEETNFGGFAGVRIPFGNGLNLTAEGQFKSEASFGVQLIKSFDLVAK